MLDILNALTMRSGLQCMILRQQREWWKSGKAHTLWRKSWWLKRRSLAIKEARWRGYRERRGD